MYNGRILIDTRGQNDPRNPETYPPDSEDDLEMVDEDYEYEMSLENDY